MSCSYMVYGAKKWLFLCHQILFCHSANWALNFLSSKDYSKTYFFYFIYVLSLCWNHEILDYVSWHRNNDKRTKGRMSNCIMVFVSHQLKTTDTTLWYLWYHQQQWTTVKANITKLNKTCTWPKKTSDTVILVK